MSNLGLGGNPTLDIRSQKQFQTLVKDTTLVIALFHVDNDPECKKIQKMLEFLSESFAAAVKLANTYAFAWINKATNEDLVKEHGITQVPTVLVFQKEKIVNRVEGSDPRQYLSILEKLAQPSEPQQEQPQRPTWAGADIPRGYSNITDQVEVRGCELLNADKEAGPVNVLFGGTAPGTQENAEAASKDWVQSGDDDQLLLFIPFQSTIKLHTLQITSLLPEGQDDVSRPSVIHLFTNRTSNMDFSEAEDAEPVQAITIEPEDWNEKGTASINLRFVKFQKTSSLVVFVQSGDGEAEKVRIDRVTFIGEAGPKREMGKLQKLDDDE